MNGKNTEEPRMTMPGHGQEECGYEDTFVCELCSVTRCYCEGSSPEPECVHCWSIGNLIETQCEGLCMNSKSDRAALQETLTKHFMPLLEGLKRVNRTLSTELDRRPTTPT